MNFIEAVKLLNTGDDSYFYEIKRALEKKEFDLSMNEPACEGRGYDNWSDKCSDLEDILEEMDKVKEKKHKVVIAKKILDYQMFWGGLGKMKI